MRSWRILKGKIQNVRISGNPIPTAGGSDLLSDSPPTVFIQSACGKTKKNAAARCAAENLLRTVRQRRSEHTGFVCTAVNYWISFLNCFLTGERRGWSKTTSISMRWKSHTESWKPHIILNPGKVKDKNFGKEPFVFNHLAECGTKSLQMFEGFNILFHQNTKKKSSFLTGESKSGWDFTRSHFLLLFPCYFSINFIY